MGVAVYTSYVEEMDSNLIVVVLTAVFIRVGMLYTLHNLLILILYCFRQDIMSSPRDSQDMRERRSAQYRWIDVIPVIWR